MGVEAKPKMSTKTMKIEEMSHGFFAKATVAEGAALYVCTGSQIFVFHPEDVNQTLAKKLVSNQIKICLDLVFIGI